MRWTPDEDATLRGLYANHTRDEIAALMGRTPGMIRSRCTTLGIASKVTKWSPEDVDKVRRRYAAAGIDPIGIHDLAKSLGRTSDAVMALAAKMGLVKANRRKIEGGQQPRPRMYGSAEELATARSERMKVWIATHGHPRGALGLKPSAENVRKMREASKRAWANPAHRVNSEAYRQAISDHNVQMTVARSKARGFVRTNTTAGRREDLGGLYVRSLWEANYARYLNWLVKNKKIAGWEYEPKTFVFEPIKRGTRTYTPDFRVDLAGGKHEWHEVKGWMDQQSRTRLARMAKYFPEERVVLIGEPWFKQAKRNGLGAIVPGWEVGTSWR